MKLKEYIRLLEELVYEDSNLLETEVAEWHYDMGVSYHDELYSGPRVAYLNCDGEESEDGIETVVLTH